MSKRTPYKQEKGLINGLAIAEAQTPDHVSNSGKVKENMRYFIGRILLKL